MINRISSVILADIGSQISGVFNSASAAGPIVMLTIAVIALVGMIGLAIWKFSPSFEALVKEIPLALKALKEETATSIKTADANAGAIGDLTESVSQFMATSNSVQEKHESNQVQLSASQEKLGGHFAQSVDVLSKISDRLGSQSTQMDMIIGDTTATRSTVKETADSVREIKQSISLGVEQLSKITHLLEEIKTYNDSQHCIEQADLDKLTTAWSSAEQKIVDAVKGLFEPAKLTVPSTATAYEVEVEKKEMSSEQV